MIRIPGKIPIAISGVFWIFAALIGYLISRDFVDTLFWVGIIFFSVLFHEFGHALTALFFGLSPRIELVAFGGLTYHEGDKLPLWKQFFIVLNGPVFGFLLFLITAGLLMVPALSQGVIGWLLQVTSAVNLYWTILNLLPLLPLDGGQLLRIMLEGLFGLKGLKASLVVSIVLALMVSLFFFLYQNIFVGAFFFLMAFQNYEMWRRSRTLLDVDRSESLQKILQEAENNLQMNKKAEAISGFEQIRREAHQGMIYNAATQYLAFLKYEEGSPQETYHLLKTIRPHLSADGLFLLHRCAFDEKDYQLVAQLAGELFQVQPHFETALRSAYAFAALAEAEAAVGWLEAAHREGVENLPELLTAAIFDPIRTSVPFQQFQASLKNSS